MEKEYDIEMFGTMGNKVEEGGNRVCEVKGISSIEQKIIDFIIGYYKETLFYPTYDEIGEHIGRKKSTVHTHMRRLENEGIIIRKQDLSPQYRLINMEYIKGKRNE